MTEAPATTGPIAPARGAAAGFLFRPILTPLMATRKVAAALVGLSAAQIAATAFHLPAWGCPFLKVTTIPCPGCGLSRACAALLHGDFGRSLHMHAFAVPILVGLAIVLVAAVLPAAPRAKVVAAIEAVERRTGATSLLLIALFVYWIARLVYAPQAFTSLVAHP